MGAVRKNENRVQNYSPCVNVTQLPRRGRRGEIIGSFNAQEIDEGVGFEKASVCLCVSCDEGVGRKLLSFAKEKIKTPDENVCSSTFHIKRMRICCSLTTRRR